MEFKNYELLNFVSRIKLHPDKKADYSGQIDGVKTRVLSAINDMPETKVIRVKRAGSWKKGTSLKPRGDNPLDVDMVFFIEVDDATEFDAEELRKEIISVLRKAYPNKDPSDFTSGKKTVGIVFKGSGLEMDIVPFIPDKGNSSYGRQPVKKLNSGEFRTSVDKQIDFIVDKKRQWASFAPATRMIKWWKDRKELDLPSFSVELLFAHLIEQGRIKSGDSIEQAIICIFEFISANKDMRVNFPGAIGVMPNEVPVIADPTNNENNTLMHISATDWNEIVVEAKAGFETISYATQVEEKGKTVDLWREIFDEFNVQEDA